MRRTRLVPLLGVILTTFSIALAHVSLTYDRADGSRVTSASDRGAAEAFETYPWSLANRSSAAAPRSAELFPGYARASARADTYPWSLANDVASAPATAELFSGGYAVANVAADAGESVGAQALSEFDEAWMHAQVALSRRTDPQLMHLSLSSAPTRVPLFGRHGLSQYLVP